ncbi:M15 family metallopeptidase [Tepidibacillus sp. LV47]|uniref:M15 family metallopeptidase n=1 Tax=Tepidibacillus sp. LV47 TaxID=3398228 RepID=UPI003AAD58E5
MQKWLKTVIIFFFFFLLFLLSTGTKSMPDLRQANNKIVQEPNQNEIKQKQNKDNQYLILVNKHHSLPANYVPNDLVVPNVPFSFNGNLPKKLMRKEAAHALEQLFQAAKKENLALYAQSGYRSYEKQKAIFTYNANQKGEEKANQTSAYPGQSEHQTGLAMDLTSSRIYFQLNESFAKTPEGKWVAKHAHEFGFIIRYPKGKEEITGYQYEPWHIRYVGKKAAEEIFKKQLTLEEYLRRK